MALLAVKHLDPVVGVDVHSVLVTPGTPPVFLPHPHVGFMLDLREYVEAAKGVVASIAMTIVEEKVTEYIEDHPDEAKQLKDKVGEMSGDLRDAKDDPDVAEGVRLAKAGKKIESRISSDAGFNAGAGGSCGRPIFVNGLLRATVGTHAFHVPGLHFPLGESFVPPPAEDPEPSNDGESFMGSKTVLANNDPMSFMALEALSCWSIGMEPPSHNSAHTERAYPSMPSSVMLPIPAGRPVVVGGPPIVNMAAAAKGLFKAFRGSKWAKSLADKLHLKPGFLRCSVLGSDPVDMITGEVIVQQHDFTVSGRLPLVWDRHYASHDMRCGAVGVGWQTPADIRLELMRHEDAVGVAAHFPDRATAFDAMPDAAGWPARVYDWQYGDALYRRGDELVLRTRAGTEYEFALPARWLHAQAWLSDDETLTLPVARMADLNGNAWAFERGPGAGLARLVECQGQEATGRTIECEAGTGNQAAGYGSLLTALVLIDTGGRAHPLVGYEHDRHGNLTAALDAMSQPHRFAYADGHRMVRHTSARGMSFHYSHRRHEDGIWRVDHTWAEGGLADYRFVYDGEHRETRMTDSLGHTTVLQADRRGLPVACIDPLGGVTSYRYDARGRANAETDPAGRLTRWTYDERGDLILQTLPDGTAVSIEYGADHQPACVSDAGGGRWRYLWDACGNLLEETAPWQTSTRYAYDIYGQMVAYTRAGGAPIGFDYDSEGNLAAIVDSLGHRSRYAYDPRANLIRIDDALGQVACYEYDRNGNLTRAIESGGRELYCSYDADGNLTRYRDPSGRLTQLEYSPLGRVTKRLAPDGNVVSYRYDTEDRLIGVINERGESYRLTRDALGRITEETDYWGQSRRYEYGANGELRRSIDPLGQAVVYETDALGRMVSKRVPDPRQPRGIRTETFSYDRSGNLVLAENPDSRVELCYDPAGRVIAERQGDEFAVEHAYDASGRYVERRTRLQTGGESILHTVRYAYDGIGALDSIQVDGAAPITFERDVLGRIRVEHLGAEIRRELSYTADGLLAKQTLLAGTGTLFVTEYAYDPNGELLEKLDSRLGTERYRYDPVGKLTAHLEPTGKLQRYLHDPAGDLLETRICEAHRSDVSGRGPHANEWVREGTYDGCYYAFDRVGNLVRKRDPRQDLLLLWDGIGQLIETRSVRRVSTSDGQSNETIGICTRYAYDAFRRRVRKVAHTDRIIDSTMNAPSACFSQSQVSRFFWDAGVLTGEIAHVDPPPQEPGFSFPLTENAERSAAAFDADSTGIMSSRRHGSDEVREWLYYPGTFRPLLGMRRVYSTPALPAKNPPTSHQAVSFFFQNEPNGAPVRMLGPDGAILWEAVYAAWGGIHRTESGSSFDQPIRLQGQYFDAETGLSYNRHRYYDCSIGQFISADPIGLSGGENLFSFAPNAIGWIDPTGLINYDKHRIHDPREFYPPEITEHLRGVWHDSGRGRAMILDGFRNFGFVVKADGSIVPAWNRSNNPNGHMEAVLEDEGHLVSGAILSSERFPCSEIRKGGYQPCDNRVSHSPVNDVRAMYAARFTQGDLGEKNALEIVRNRLIVVFDKDADSLSNDVIKNMQNRSKPGNKKEGRDAGEIYRKCSWKRWKCPRCG